MREKCEGEILCTALNDRLNDGNARGKGLSGVDLMNLRTMKTSFIGVCYKRSSKDRGLMINFCPWCGASLEHLFRREEQRKT